MRHTVILCVGIMLLGILCSVPAAADVPTNLVDQYWVWYPMPPGVPSNDPGYWVNPIDKLGLPDPVWAQDFTSVWVPNRAVPDRVKNIWVEVKYLFPQTQMADLLVCDPAGVAYKPHTQWISTNGQFLTWQWTLPYQPESETIAFGGTDFYFMRGIELVEIGTQCVPEPGSILALACGCAGLVGFVRRRK